MLLSNTKVAEFLKAEVVPSWEMVREVPKVTIDFGNGKVLKRTLAGNTVMYLCNPQGEVIDAFPGVYTPDDFLEVVRPALVASTQTTDWPSWHKKSVGPIPTSGRMTASKGGVESPLVMLLRGKRPNGRFPKESEDGLSKDATIRQTFEFASKRLEDISKQGASPDESVRRVGGNPEKMTAEQKGQMLVAVDSATNVTMVRAVVHLWAASLEKPVTPAQAKDDLFEKILHIPYKDPYLGLADVAVPGTSTPGRGNR